SLFMIPVAVYLLVMSEEVVRLMFSDKYMASVLPFRIYLFFLFARVTNFGSLEMAAGKNRLILWISFCGLLANLVLSIILVRVMGYIGAAVATIMVVYFLSIPLHFFVYRYVLKLSVVKLIPFRKLCVVALCSLAACVPLLLIKVFVPGGDIIKILLTGAVYFALIFGAFRLTGFADPAAILRDLKVKN
ncbi:MAG: polysaccharide biosynthesis C-terminal domain-containing protein, partial [Candidatus Omnitrophota bacterium]